MAIYSMFFFYSGPKRHGSGGGFDGGGICVVWLVAQYICDELSCACAWVFVIRRHVLSLGVVKATWSWRQTTTTTTTTNNDNDDDDHHYHHHSFAVNENISEWRTGKRRPRLPSNKSRPAFFGVLLLPLEVKTLANLKEGRWYFAMTGLSGRDCM